MRVYKVLIHWMQHNIKNGWQEEEGSMLQIQSVKDYLSKGSSGKAFES